MKKTIEHNKIYCIDCIDGLKMLHDNSIDFIITDPPFNVGINYEGVYDDNINDHEYYKWCYKWILELYRVLKEGQYCIIFTGDLKLYYIHKAIMKSCFDFHHFLKTTNGGDRK